MLNSIYQETILEELKNPQNYGEMGDADIVVEETNASCGDEVKVFIALEEDPASRMTVIKDISWTGVGCAISQASMSLLSDKIKNMSRDEIFRLEQKDIEELLGIEEISIGRIKCMMLGLKAINKALHAL